MRDRNALRTNPPKRDVAVDWHARSRSCCWVDVPFCDRSIDAAPRGARAGHTGPLSRTRSSTWRATEMRWTQRLSVEIGEQHEAGKETPEALAIASLLYRGGLNNYLGVRVTQVRALAAELVEVQLRVRPVRLRYHSSATWGRMVGATTAARRQSYPIASFTFKRHLRTTNTLIGTCLVQPITSFVGAALLHWLR